MLSYKEALQKIKQTIKPLPVEKRPLDDILNSILAEPVNATFDLPSFDNSAMDGYGVKFKDVEKASPDNPIKLSLEAEIEAGSLVNFEIESGKAVKIFTGAKVPSSVDAVVMREYCEESDGYVLIKREAKDGENIRRRAEEYAKGDLVLEAGIKVTPPVVGLLASFGYKEFPVYQNPTVSIIGTGNELIEPGEKLEEGQIFDSNSYALSAAIQSLGLAKPITKKAVDTEESIEQALTECLNSSDVVITAGGVSVGDKDLVKSVLEKNLNVETVFWRAKVKPGKPIYFGRVTINENEKFIFGLPGNPVSALVTFHLFVKPALSLLQGHKIAPKREWQAKMVSNRKKKPGRLDFVRGRLSSNGNAGLAAEPSKGQGSHMLSGLANADCLIHFSEEADSLEKDSLVTVEELNWQSY